MLSTQFLRRAPMPLCSRCYSLCCPPRKPAGQQGCSCPSDPPVANRNIVPPIGCRVGGRIAYNPCCPTYHHGHDTWKKYMYFTMFVSFPLIIIQAFHALGHSPPEKTECRDYEYMRIRTKRFPWGDGVASLFHNPHVNFLPGECVPPPLDCD